MAFLTETEVRYRANRAAKVVEKSLAQKILEARSSVDEIFDVFLSHSSSEPDEILKGVMGVLEDAGLSVYIDKYCDPSLSPEKVTPETTEILRQRMRNSLSLLYVHSQHSRKSRWMSWELGYFDGLKGKVGIIPVASDSQNTSFRGEEYLNLYPYVDIAQQKDSNTTKLWINDSVEKYALLVGWIKGSDEIKKRS